MVPSRGHLSLIRPAWGRWCAFGPRRRHKEACWAPERSARPLDPHPSTLARAPYCRSACLVGVSDKIVSSRARRPCVDVHAQSLSYLSQIVHVPGRPAWVPPARVRVRRELVCTARTVVASPRVGHASRFYVVVTTSVLFLSFRLLLLTNAYF